MRKSLWIILVVLFAAIVAPRLHADPYTPTFTCVQSPCPGRLPTAPGVTFSSPTVVTEMWDGFTIVFDLPPTDAPANVYTWSDCYFTPACPLSGFGITDVTLGVTTFSTSLTCPPSGCSPRDTAANGSLSFVTPEPGTAVLWLTGMLLVILMRKRIANRLRLDTGSN
jgi:hypothetical protein